jgi:hypothetical protein
MSLVAEAKPVKRKKAMDGTEVKEPRVDQEFAKFLRPLTHSEEADLESQLTAEGCQDRLVVWQENNILLDGHHRRQLCKRLKIPFEYRYISLPDREAAKKWIIQHQFGRRNSTELERKDYIGMVYDLEVGTRGGAQDEERENVAQNVGEQFGVSTSTVLNDHKLHLALRRLGEESPEARKQAIEQNVNATEISKLAKVDDKVIAVVAKKLADGQAFEKVIEHVPIQAPKRTDKPQWNDAKITDQLGSVARMLAARAKDLKMKDSQEYKDCDEALDVLLKKWKALQKATNS